jgi:hypothetical protein
VSKKFPAKSFFIGVSVFFITSLASSAVLFAAIPQPSSAGKFTPSKGTKAAPVYQEQGRAGSPGYEWGRGLQLGKVLLKPFIQYLGQLEDNIFYDPSNEKSDYISRLSAGTTAELPLNGGQHLLTGKFAEELEWFAKNDDQDHNDYSYGGGLDLNFVPFSLNVEDTELHTVDRADTEFTSRVTRDENLAHGLLEIPLARFFLETEALNFNTDYRAPENKVFNHNEFTIFQRVGLDIAPTTQFLGEYSYENLDYSKNGERNGDANQVMLGFRGNLTERIVYQVWGGYQARIYDNNARPDFYGFVTRDALQYDLTDKSSVTLVFNRDAQESTFDNQSFYVRNKGSIAWKQQLAERLLLHTDGALSYNEYSRITVQGTQQQTRRDYVWETGIGLEYLMPNDVVSFFGEYRHRSRSANLDGLDYGDNILNAGVKAAF